MLLSKFAAFQTLQLQSNALVYLVTLPICAINAVPFLAHLFPLSRIQKRVILAVAIALNSILITLAVWLTRQHIYNIGYDTWMHLALIQRGVADGLFAGDPYYVGFPTPPHYSVVDIFCILLSKALHIAPHLLWGNLSPIFATLIFLSFIWWYKELIGDPVLGWLAGLLFIVSIAGEWHYAIYPRNAALILFALSHLFYFQSVRTKKDKYILYTGISIGLCIMSHLFAGIMCLISLVAYIFVNWLVEKIHRRPRMKLADLRCLASIPIGLVVASPWLIVFGKQALMHDEASISHYSLPGSNIEAKIPGWTYTCYKPDLFWKAFPTLLWLLAGLGLLICLYQVIRGNYKPHHVFLLSAAVIPVLVLFTPLYSPIVNTFGEWMPSRFMKIVPVPALTALSGGAIFQLLFSLRTKHRKQSIVIRSSGILLGFIAMLIVIPPSIEIQKNLHLVRNQVLAPLDTWDSDFHELEGILKNKVVLTDPWTSYFLPYYTEAFTVAIPAAHGSPYINHEARLADVSAMLNPQTTIADRHELLDRYRVDYVMLNLRPEMDKEASRYGLIKGYYLSSIKEVLDQHSEFALVYDNNGLFVYAFSSPETHLQNKIWKPS